MQWCIEYSKNWRETEPYGTEVMNFNGFNGSRPTTHMGARNQNFAAWKRMQHIYNIRATALKRAHAPTTACSSAT